jgi:2-dehydropantoate 2-reductase
MRVAVYGAGSVGGYFGGRLAQAGTDVHLIARGPHLAALQTHGLRVRSVQGDFTVRAPATDHPASIGPCDYVLFCVKSFDTQAAAARLEPLLQQDTAVVSLQNGVDNEDKLVAAIGPRHVMGGVAYIFADLAEPGVVVHTGGPSSIAFGELDGRDSQRARRLLDRLQQAGIPAELSLDIRRLLWVKFAFLCAFAGMTAAVRLPIGEIRGVDASWAAFRRLLEEVWELAAAEGVPLPVEVREQVLAGTQASDSQGTSSLHNDLAHGRRMELEALHGLVVRRAANHGLAVPFCQMVYAILKPWAVRHEHAHREPSPPPPTGSSTT